MGDIVIDADFVKYLASLGVGGVIAGMMFHFYRRDVATYTQQWKGQSDALMTVVRDNMGIVRENTAALTKMATLLEALHRRIDSEGSR